jgi:hypothetical protein
MEGVTAKRAFVLIAWMELRGGKSIFREFC